MEDDSWVPPFDPADLLPFKKRVKYEKGHKAFIGVRDENDPDLILKTRGKNKNGGFSARA